MDRAAMWPGPRFSRLALVGGLTVLLGRGRAEAGDKDRRLWLVNSTSLAIILGKMTLPFPQSDILTLKESLFIKETCHGEKILKRNAGKCCLQPGSLLSKMVYVSRKLSDLYHQKPHNFVSCF